MRFVKALVLVAPMVCMTVGAVSTLGVIGALSASPAYAAEKKISAKVGKPLQEALKLAGAGQLKEAMAKAQEADGISGKSAFEDYKVNEVLAYIAVKLGDYATAAKAYEATLKSGEVPADQAIVRLDQLTKIYYQLKNYPKAIELGNRYLKEGGNDITAAVVVMQSYYLQKDNTRAIEAAHVLFDMANKNGQPVQEEWLKLLLNCQLAANKESDAVKTLDQLLDRFPSPQLWSQRLSYAQTHGGSSDRKNLEIYRLKFLLGVLKESEYVDMAQLSIALGFPGDAITVLEKGFANKTLGVGPTKDRQERLLNLAKTNAAKDKQGLPSFEKEAKAAASGDGDVKLGEAYTSYGDYDKAVEAIKRGLKKGNVKDEDEAHLLLGITYFNLKKTTDAVAQFKSVPTDSKLADIAHLWAIYANNHKA